MVWTTKKDLNTHAPKIQIVHNDACRNFEEKQWEGGGVCDWADLRGACYYFQ